MVGPGFLTVDWVLGQFGQRKGLAQEKYRCFVAEGISGRSPWDKLKGQIYLGSEGFVARYQPGQKIGEIPRRQTQTRRPDLRELFTGKRIRDKVIREAYRQYGYRLWEIAEHLGVHYSTVSRHLKKVEETGA